MYQKWAAVTLPAVSQISYRIMWIKKSIFPLFIYVPFGCASLLLLFLFGHLNFWIFFFFFMLFNFFFNSLDSMTSHIFIFCVFFLLYSSCARSFGYFLHVGTWTQRNKQKRNTCADSYATFFLRVMSWDKFNKGSNRCNCFELVCNWGLSFLWIFMSFCVVFDFKWIFEVETLEWRYINLKILVWRLLNYRNLLWRHLYLTILVWRHLNLWKSSVKTTELQKPSEKIPEPQKR